MDSQQTGTVPMPEASTPWAGHTKDRLIARRQARPTTEEERRVARAVTRAQRGDREAMRFLYLTYADNVYGYVRTIVRDHHDAEDVTQQVFAKLMTTITKYEPRGVPFVAWLLRTAHNVAIDTVRARRETPADEIFGADERTSDHDGDDARALRTAIESLPGDQREVVVLRHVLGLTPVEIAQATGRTHSSVYGLHHRGRRALCAELTRLESVPTTATTGLAVAA